jgi:glutamyl-tRNA(Gln) amidotransferase subunit E
VELDEEPPRGPNEEAVEIACSIALKLNADVVDEIHFMRKLVIDGSNTSGFQRTAVIAFDGHIETSQGRVNIPTIALEEEAARKVSGDDRTTTYNLDRFGIPLIEITTAPDIKSAKQAREAALKIGELLRAFKVKRGIGIIRQDINVSIKGGARVEVKGVQELNSIPGLIENEVKRQEGLIDISEKLKNRKIGSKTIRGGVHDVTGVFKGTRSKVLLGEIKQGGVFAVSLPGFAGLLGGGLLGREIAGSVRVHSGVKGIFHSDEFPGHGIVDNEVDGVKKALSMREEDAFVLVAGREGKARKALEVVFDRAELALKGPLEETRMAKDSMSEYMRPLPGAARMYPETDILPYVVSADLVKKLKINLPQTYEERKSRLIKNYNLSSEQSYQMARLPEGGLNDFEARAPKLKNLATSGFASLYLDGAKEVDNIKVNWSTIGIFGEYVDKGMISLAGAPTTAIFNEVLDEVKKGNNIRKVLDHWSGEKIDLEGIIDKIIAEKSDFIREKGEFVQKPIMGLVMKETRGKVDGKKVNEVLKKKLEEFLSR